MNVNVNVNSDFHRLEDDESVAFDRPSEVGEPEEEEEALSCFQRQIFLLRTIPRYRRMLWITNIIQCVLIFYVYTYQELYVLYIFVGGIVLGFLAISITQLQALLSIYSLMTVSYAMYLAISVANETQESHWDHVAYHFSLAFFEFFAFALSGYNFYQYVRGFFIKPTHTKNSSEIDPQEKSSSVLPSQTASASRSWFNTPQHRHMGNGRLDNEYLTNSSALHENSVNTPDSNPFLTPSFALAPSPLVNHGRSGSRGPGMLSQSHVEQHKIENLRYPSSHSQTTDNFATFTHYHHYIHEIEDDAGAIARPQLPRPQSQHHPQQPTPDTPKIGHR